MKNLFFLFSFVLLTACGAGKSSKDEPILVEARKIHKEAIQIHKDVMKDITEVKKLKNSLTEKDKEKNQKAIEACDNQILAMADWMKNIQEVPGTEHDHHDHEGHDHHDHKPTTQASAPDVLAYQKEMKTKIEQLQKDVKMLLETAKK